MTRLEDKLGKLEESYKASMARPNLDDSDGEEQIIERLAREVTEVSWMAKRRKSNAKADRDRPFFCSTIVRNIENTK